MNDASLSYQYLADSQAENAEKSKLLDDYRQNITYHEQNIAYHEQNIAYLEQNIAYHEQTLKTKDEHIERITNSLINLSGHRAQFSYPQCPRFVRPPQIVTSVSDLPCAHRTARPSPY